MPEAAPEAAFAAARRRNSVLQGLELFRDVGAPRPFSAMILFLYACENEGLTFTELASLAGMPLASASRLVNALAGPAKGASAPSLFSLEPAPFDGRLKLIHLNKHGRALRDGLEGLISEARPIRAQKMN
jgi:hypothetical protein